MMTSMIEGSRPIAMYDAEMTGEGRGRLYLLSNGILFDARRRGTVFEVHFDDIVKFWTKRPEKFFIAIRSRWGNKTSEFKVCASGQAPPLPGLVEIELDFAISEYRQTRALQQKYREVMSGNDIHIDLLYRSEAFWLECNWYKVMAFVRPERALYLNEFVRNARIGTPYKNPYELVAKFEGLRYTDFANLAGFLKWRYGDMTEAEVETTVSLFRDMGITITEFEFQVELQSRLEDYAKCGRSLFEHVAQVLAMRGPDKSTISSTANGL